MNHIYIMSNPKRRKFTLLDLQKFAKARGGKCTSTSYVKASDKQLWICKQGHKFQMRWDTLTKFSPEKQWCRYCKYDNLETLQTHAKKMGGELLSTKYIFAKTRYTWRCKENHEWCSIWTNVKNGAWCRKCCNRKYTIKNLQEFASSKRGKCLSEKYEGKSLLYTWECQKGHEWDASWDNVLYGKTWCPRCVLHNGSRMYTLEQLIVYARNKGGSCLSDEYTGVHSKYQWECQKRHQWEAQWSNIRIGGWCPQCNKFSLEVAQEVANDNGGWCLSDEYTNDKTPMLWKCYDGHQWKSTLNSIRHQGTWCSICKGYRLELKIAQDIARKKGGECLSKKYINRDSYMKWRCGEGHEWTATLACIRGVDRWCPKCWLIRIQPTIKELKKIAKSRGGELLSVKYKNNTAKLLWKCKLGHTWKSSSASVKNSKSWCPKCLWKSEQACREILEDIFGEYINYHFPKCRPEFLRGLNHPNGCLELDGYNDFYKIAFEYQGIQHYKYIPFFHKNGKKDLIETQRRDALKRERCKKEGIRLIEIPCDYTFENMEKLRDYIEDQIPYIIKTYISFDS